ncbi:MAG: hypothetical protein U9R75_11960 [Candidatus Thermoplasmatota archaeon]|nr:hypothetical protein [Candidatus Thermoplasmatota archaeon]
MAKKLVASFIVSLMVILVFNTMMVGSQETNVVRSGEPLHLYLRRKPVQDMTYLHFYPPDNDLIGSNVSYRETLQQKGNVGDSFPLMFYPQSRESNFLQFEPNSSVQFHYHFVISAQNPPPPIVEEPVYRVKVLIELDYEHDGKYDRELSFEISGVTGKGPEIKEGNVQFNIGSLERFEGETGGRVRVNISRQDNLGSVVTIYCGTDGYNSYFQLPYSKYKYLGGSDDPSVDLYIVIGIIFFVGVIVVVFMIYKDSGKRKEKEPEKKGRRRKR